MFRKKKNVGNVTVFEEEARADDAADDTFDDLGLAERRRESVDAAELDGMTAVQLEALAVASANAGKDGTGRALVLAREAREVGIGTAGMLKDQTAQLEKMGDDIEVVHDYLDKSERIIDKMSKPKIVRMFQRKKPVGKGLNKVRGSKKEVEAREAMKKNGVDALDMEKMAGSSKDGLDMEDLAREELFSGATPVADVKGRKSRFGRPSKAPQVPVNSRDIKEDYSHYTEGVATVMRQQDDDLDEISDALADMQSLATAMGQELTYQDKLITEVQDFTAETSRRTKANARRVNQIK